MIVLTNDCSFLRNPETHQEHGEALCCWQLLLKKTPPWCSIAVSTFTSTSVSPYWDIPGKRLGQIAGFLIRLRIFRCFRQWTCLCHPGSVLFAPLHDFRLWGRLAYLDAKRPAKAIPFLFFLRAMLQRESRKDEKKEKLSGLPSLRQKVSVAICGLLRPVWWLGKILQNMSKCTNLKKIAVQKETSTAVTITIINGISAHRWEGIEIQWAVRRDNQNTVITVTAQVVRIKIGS